MNVSEILKELEFNTGAFPRQALQEAVARREEITPALLKIIEEARLRPEVIQVENYMGHIYAMYLLAQFREKRAYPLIVGFFSIPGDVTMDCTGDLVTVDLHRILASVARGDAGLIKSLVGNDQASEWVRGAALEALLTQFACGEATRDEVMAYYRSLFRGRLTREPSQVWNDLVSCCTDLYPEEVMPEIKRAYREDLVDHGYMGLGEVTETLARSKERVLSELSKNDRYCLIEDVIADIEWWACFRDYPEPHRATPKPAVPQRIAQVRPKVGRNEPCPCGSGKKYKKCCGK